MDLEKLETSITRSLRWVFVVLAILIGFYFIWFVVIQGFTLSKEPGRWGEFGDFVGGILNPLIAIFAVYWLSRSILIQKEELSETRIALRETQAAHERQVELAVLASKIQSLNIRLSIINSQLSAKLDHRNILLGASNATANFIGEDGGFARVGKILPKVNAEIQAYRKSQTELLTKIEELLDET